jgi:hypothetical protein
MILNNIDKIFCFCSAFFKSTDFLPFLPLPLKGEVQKIINPRQNFVGLAFRDLG